MNRPDLDRPVLVLVLAASAALLLPGAAAAQGTPADYARAQTLRATYEGLAVDIAGPATVIGNTHRFWYRKTVRGAEQFVVVDADTQQRQPAFDHDKLAASLSKAAGSTFKATALPFNTLTFTTDGTAFTVNVEGSPYRCTVVDATCRKAEAGPRSGEGRRRQDDSPRLSPDGQWEALINNFNVAVRPAGARTVTRLSSDGSEGNAYQLSSIAWSPDSKKIAAYRVKPGYRRQVHYVESSPEDQLQPKYSSLTYAKPGDLLDVDQPVIFAIDSRRQLTVDNALFPNAYAMSDLEWRKDSRTLTFEYNQRGHQVYRVIEVDAATGAARAVISEEPKTFFTYRTANGTLADSGKQFRYDVDEGREIIWMSERDGWNHLYLYDGVTGAVKNQITKGEWVVRAVERVDPVKRQIWFSAGGMYPGKDPYFVNYYRINFDGSGLTRLTDSDGNHAAAFSRDMTYYVDTYSRVDLPPVIELRRTADDAPRLDARARRHHRAREGRLEGAGGLRRQGARRHDRHLRRHHPPEPVRSDEEVPGDREHLRRPARLVRAEIVLGLQPDAVAGRARLHRRADRRHGHVEPLEGVPRRGAGRTSAMPAFPTASCGSRRRRRSIRTWTSRASASTAARRAGRTRLAALLFHGEFYKVGRRRLRLPRQSHGQDLVERAVDGLADRPAVSASVERRQRDKLQGKLLLVVGELDTNVDPASTMQVVNPLIKHDKDFDLLVVPGANHPAGRGNDPTAPYGDHKRFDFFVQHLLGVTPPNWNRTSTSPTDHVPQR